MLIFTNASLFVLLCVSVFIAVGEQDVIVVTVTGINSVIGFNI